MKKTDAKEETCSDEISNIDAFDSDIPLGEPRGQPNLDVMRHRLLSTASNFTSPWITRGPDSMPDMSVPETEPLCTHELPDATLSSMSSVLEANEWPIPTFMSQFNEASDFNPCKWARSCRVEGTAVRVLTFTMPLPKEIPRAVAMLINLPEKTKITNTYRLRKTEDELILMCQVNSPEVPFGEYFRIQELNSFRALPGRGVEVRKWVEVMWVLPVPWGMGPVKVFTENKILDDFRKGAGPLANFLNDAAVVKMKGAGGNSRGAPCRKQRMNIASL
jgi:hypothetical protein